MKNGKAKKPSKLTTEEKTINIWQSLTSVGAGFGSWGNTLAADVQLLSLYVNHPFVNACANLNANTVSAVPFKVYKVQKKASAVTTKGRKLKRKEAKRLNRFRKAALADDAEVVELSEHDLYDMLNTEAEDLRGVNILKATQLYLEVLGRAYWLVERSAVDDSPISIRVLRSEFVTPIVDAEGIVTGYVYTNFIDGTINKVPLDKSNVIDFRNPALTNLYAGGQSWVRAAYQQVSASAKWFEYVNRILDNKARPDYLVSPKNGNLTQDQLERFSEGFLKKVKSSNNGGPVFVEDAVTVTPLNFQPQDLGGLEISKEAKKDIALVADIPGPLVGVEDKTYSNYETALEDYARRAVLPRCRSLEDVFNARIVPLFADEVFVEFDNPVPEDEAFELEQEKVGITKATEARSSGKVTVNEYRAMLGLEPLDEGGDELLAAPAAPPAAQQSDEGDAEGSEDDPADGDASNAGADDSDSADESDEAEGKSFDRLLKLNVAVAKGKLPRAIAINIAERLGFCEAKTLIGYPIANKAAERCGCAICDAAKAIKPKAMSEAERAALAEAFHANLKQQSGDVLKSQGVNSAGAEEPHTKIQAACAKFFKDLGAEAIRQTKAYKPQLETKADDTGNLPQEFIDLEDWVKNLKGKADDLAHRVKPLISIQAQEGADGKAEALIRAGADPDVFAVVPQNVSKAADKRAYRFAQSTLDTTRKTAQDAIDEVKEKVESGVLEGDSVDELRRAISNVFENASDYQAERIARTEASAAVHSGQVMAAKASGIVKGFKYLVSDDACDVCQDYADETIDLDDYDDSGAVDAEDVVPLHPNCTCTLMEVLDLGDNDNE